MVGGVVNIFGEGESDDFDRGTVKLQENLGGGCGVQVGWPGAEIGCTGSRTEESGGGATVDKNPLSE